MVLEEIQHIRLDIPEKLPVPCDACGGLPELYRHPVVVHILFNDCPQGIIQPRLVIEIVKADLTDVFPVEILLIHLRNEDNSRELFPDTSYEPSEEFCRDQLDHVAPEAVDTFTGPETDSIIHPVPCAAMAVAIVYLYRLIPVIYAWCRAVAIVACRPGRHFPVWHQQFFVCMEESPVFGPGLFRTGKLQLPGLPPGIFDKPCRDYKVLPVEVHVGKPSAFLQKILLVRQLYRHPGIVEEVVLFGPVFSGIIAFA